MPACRFSLTLCSCLSAETDHIALNQVFTVTGDIDRRHAFQTHPVQVWNFSGFKTTVSNFSWHYDASSFEMLFQCRSQTLFCITFGQGTGFARRRCALQSNSCFLSLLVELEHAVRPKPAASVQAIKIFERAKCHKKPFSSWIKNRALA